MRIALADNPLMDKMELRQILARKIRDAMERDPNLETQQKMAARAGISQGHISRLLLCEAAATTDALVGLAKAMRCQPWELLADGESTRRAAIERMLGRDGAPDLQVTLPPKIPAMRRKKKGV